MSKSHNKLLSEVILQGWIFFFSYLVICIIYILFHFLPLATETGHSGFGSSYSREDKLPLMLLNSCHKQHTTLKLKDCKNTKKTTVTLNCKDCACSVSQSIFCPFVSTSSPHEVDFSPSGIMSFTWIHLNQKRCV